MKKRFLSLVVTTTLAASLLAGCGNAAGNEATPAQAAQTEEAKTEEAAPAQEETAAQEVEVTMFVWAGANQGVVPMAVAEQYEKDHPGVTINVIESTNSEMYSQIVAGRETDPDNPVINFGYFNASCVAKGVNDNLWAPLDESAIPNMADIPAQYHVDGNLGIEWGISDFGIIYNSDLLSEEEAPKTWDDLWENPKFEGKVALWDYLLYPYIPPVIENHPELGASYEDPTAAFEYVAEHIGQVNSLVTSADQLQNLLVSGEALVAPYCLQPAQVWKQDGAPIEVVIPEGGTIQFPYYLEVVEGSSDAQKQVAFDIINILLEADNLTEYANQTGTPVLGLSAAIPENYADDPLFDLSKRSGINPDWVTMSVHNAEWNEQYERIVKTAIE